MMHAEKSHLLGEENCNLYSLPPGRFFISLLRTQNSVGHSRVVTSSLPKLQHTRRSPLFRQSLARLPSPENLLVLPVFLLIKVLSLLLSNLQLQLSIGAKFQLRSRDRRGCCRYHSSNDRSLSFLSLFLFLLCNCITTFL